MIAEVEAMVSLFVEVRLTLELVEVDALMDKVGNAKLGSKTLTAISRVDGV